MEEKKIFSVQEHLRKTWEVFKQYGLKLALLSLFPAVLALVLGLLGGLLGVGGGALSASSISSELGGVILHFLRNLLGEVLPLALIPFTLLAFLFFLYVAYWASAAQINYLNVGQPDMEFGEVFKSGRKFTLPLISFSLLSGFIIGGASMLFVLPGLIFSFFFIFGQYILIIENKSVKQSLLLSREYLRGHEWSVLGRLLILGLGLLVIWIPFWLLGLIPFIGPLFSQCTGIFIGAIFMCYFFVLYKEIVRLKGPITQELFVGKSLTKYTLVSILGWFVGLLTAIIIIAITVLFSVNQQKIQQNQFQQSQQNLQNNIQNIQNETNVQNNVELKTE